MKLGQIVTRRSARLALGFVVLAFSTAPVPGDVGGCSQRAAELDPEAFFSSKQFIDCERCNECRIGTRTCERACGSELVQRSFPEGCVALVHDGEVCLRALLAASCDESRAYLRDEGATTPGECNFCPLREVE